jgi:hypothetical protein
MGLGTWLARFFYRGRDNRLEEIIARTREEYMRWRRLRQRIKPDLKARREEERRFRREQAEKASLVRRNSGKGKRPPALSF